MRSPVQASNVVIADAVGEGFKGQRDAGQFIAKVRASAGDGNELHHAVRALADRSEAYRMAWFRRIQKSLES
jgi:hypothetical protein